MTTDKPVVLHRGVYKKVATVGEATFMITGMTIGAGILGIPYVVAQVGLGAGLAYILVLGLTMLYLNLVIGEIAVRTKEELQLPGFAGKYLGRWAKGLMSVIIILSGYGALLAYVVGEGQILTALLGGNAIFWSVVFWSVGSVLVWRGLHTVKTVEKILSLAVMVIIVGLSLYLLPQIKTANLFYQNWASLFLPYGVILFALHATPAVVEAHALLPGSQRHFRRAVILGTLIPVALYLLFALAVVGVSGLGTTAVATIGLGEKFGSGILFCANLFALFSMGTGFFGFGVALKQTFMWDYKLSQWAAEFLVISVPLVLFLWGLRNFIEILDIVGGLFIGIEAILMILIFLRARRYGDLSAARYRFRLFWIFLVPVLVIFSCASVYSVIKIFS